jgi:DNA-nicking Smr family endonuclease
VERQQSILSERASTPIGGDALSGDPVMSSDDDDPVALPIDGILDLHAFAPRDVPGVVADYLDACREEDVLEVRIIHGKGIGASRRTVASLLARRDDVARYGPADESAGGWGATLVTLSPKPR